MCVGGDGVVSVSLCIHVCIVRISRLCTYRLRLRSNRRPVLIKDDNEDES